MSMPGSVVTGMVTPKVSLVVGGFGAPLNPMVAPLLVRTVVDTSVHRPGMFELTFLDTDGMLLDLSLIDVGSEIRVEVDSGPMPTSLILGEVTSIEGDYDHLVRYTTIRGYEHSHRLQRARRTRSFLDSTDGDIARRIASDADIDVGDVQDPGVTHRWIGQVAQTDWEFLTGRAAEIGYETGVSDGELYFRPAPGMSAGGGLAGAASAAASAVGLGGCTLKFGENLRSLRSRVSSAGLTPEAEVRVWDPESKGVVSAVASLESETADVPDDPVAMANAYGGPLSLPSIPSIPGLPSFLGASANAAAFVDRPLGWGSTAQSEADAMAAGMAEHQASTYAEAEGMAVATPELVAGAKVTLDNVPDKFAGDWNVTAAQHVFDNDEGYTVRFEISGRHDRSLHGLMNGGRLDRRKRGLIDGLVPGIVTDNIDEDGMLRVKVALPWLSPDFVTDWARVAMPGLGATYGFVALPEVGDEVLVGFEFGDVRRAYVLGGLGNGESELELGGDPVKQGIPGGIVVKRGLVSRLGHKLLVDDDGDGTLPPSTSGITIGNGDDTITIQLDDVNKKLTILCDSTGPPAAIEIKQNGAGGSITIEQAGTGGTLDIKGAGNVSVEAAAPGALTLKGGTGVTIDAGPGMVELKGSMVKLN